MSTDRALLEAAAKAAGMKTRPFANGHCARWDESDAGNHLVWNPITDDGDALRLAVQIGPLEFSISEYGTAVRKPKGQWFGYESHLHGGKQAATRRAIVRAAAAMAPKETP